MKDIENRNNIIIISREEWSNMRMSKQNYAIELARLGFDVFFLHCPDRRKRLKRGEVILKSTEFNSIKVVDHRLFFPLFLKYKFYYIYQVLIRVQLLLIMRKIKIKPHIIWSFDTESDLPLSIFNNDVSKIYMPVDGPFMHDFEMINGNSADIIVSVTDRILERYKQCHSPKLKVNHGVNNSFYGLASPEIIGLEVRRVGYSGSLVRNDLRVDFFKKMIVNNPEIVFEFWGEFDFENSSIHFVDDVSCETKNFVTFLQETKNVILHGAVNQHELAVGLNRMDILLIAYNIVNDQNHHKVNEYLTTGKLIVSTYMSSFQDTDLFLMSENSCSDDELYELFTEAIHSYNLYMTIEKILMRKKIGIENSYQYLTKKILNHINTASFEG